MKSDMNVVELNKSDLIKRWLCSCLFIFFGISCSENNGAAYFVKEFEKINQTKPLVKTGDLIVRNGNDEVSLATRKFNRKDTSYSHCGIIQIENDSVFVYHALGGSYNPSQTLMRQVIDSFCNPIDVDKFAVYRYDITPLQNKLLTQTVIHHFTNRLPFDLFFNYESNDKMYCSEFVFKSLNAATGNYFLLRHPKTSPEYITVDDLYLNPKATLVKKIEF